MKYFYIFFTFLHFFSFLLTKASINPSSESSTKNSKKIDIFISNLITQKFSHCSLLFVQDRNDNSRTLNYIVEKTNLNYYNIKYSYPLNSELEIKSSRNLSSILINSPQNLPIKFEVSVSNYNRRNNNCKVVIMTITDLRPEFMKNIFKIITPVYIPITKKDRDFFILITEPRLMDKLLLMQELPGRIKFKIAVGAIAKKSAKVLVIKTVCFFCGEGGTPKILEYNNNNMESSGVVNYFPDFVKNLNGKVLRVACPAISSRIQTKGPPFKGLMNAERGMWKNLFEEFLMVKFNFTYNIFLSTGKNGRFGGGGTGLELPNGTWIGTVGDIVAGRADFGIVTANTPKRIRQVDFTNSFFDVGFLIFTTSQAQRVYSPLALLWPFDYLMWFLIFLSTLFAFFVFGSLSKFMLYLGMEDNSALSFARRGIQSKDQWGLEHQIFFVITTYLDQDTVMPRFQPLRCFVSLWLFFTLILTTVYRSKLVSLLAFPIIAKLPETFEQLAQSDYEVGFVKHGDSAYNTLKASTDPIYVSLLNEMEIITGVGLECLERAVSKKYGCIAYDFSTKYLKERNLSDMDIRNLVFAPATTYNIFMGLVTEGGSIYKENFDKWLGLTRSFHLAHIWEQRDFYYNVRLPKRAWWMETNQMEKMKKSDGDLESSDLTLKHISGAFYILLFGLGFCTLVFIYELFKFYIGGYRIEILWRNFLKFNRKDF